MNILTIAWLTLPFFIGFVIYLLPKLDKYLALGITFVSAGYALLLFLEQSPVKLQLLDNFGVELVADNLSAYFILTNAIVTAAVIFYCWDGDKTAFFYSMMIILHGSINSPFVCADFVSLYVALEVSGIAAFLLIAYPRTDRSLWVALRYLFISNTAMLFYLVGAALVYQTHNSFRFEGLKGAPPEALALIFLGLLIKGGIFVSGLWLPLTHSESETPVSALLSGIVIKASILPLLRCALISDDINQIVRIFGVATALMGICYAVFEKDTKRMLAFHTISQLGFILVAPAVGGVYALAHGLVKSTLFLISGSLPSRNLKELQYKPIDPNLWIALVIASLSISGFPLLAGFGAKALTIKNLADWQVIPMNIAAVGTAISFAKFIFIPRGEKQKVQPGLWPAIALLISGLIIANVVYLDAYTIETIIKALLTIAIGWLIYVLFIKRLAIALPRVAEEFDHLVGVMSLTLLVLFWMVLACIIGREATF
ncbi:cation:proton antiporter [Tychonema sp. LEGE 06208]|uniref:cation:proton antiporter n=1 Tax=Tychonema sp. LEGE 06208 TaxID=1828663 RepID=UPI001881E84D|nr:cation:proton antiporter [Tychonema sp. LEGE 06208]MBE9163880.1 cation:proton antiporter [Tychonema sp. LEGE 06208]